MEKKLSEITRNEWITIRWEEIRYVGSEERVFLADGKRTPDEAAQAMDDWDSTAEERAEGIKEVKSCLQNIEVE